MMSRRDFAKCVGVVIAYAIFGKLKLDELADDDEEEPTMPR